MYKYYPIIINQWNLIILRRENHNFVILIFISFLFDTILIKKLNHVTYLNKIHTLCLSWWMCTPWSFVMSIYNNIWFILKKKKEKYKHSDLWNNNTSRNKISNGW